MSDSNSRVYEATECGHLPCDAPLEVLNARQHTVGANLPIRRALPLMGRRMVGAWCFLDHFGPATFAEREQGMWVGPHPHIGLQTVTWMVEGEVLHRDSIGSEQVIRPGQLNVMTSGRGISHTEESPAPDGTLHGVQLWVALPSSRRHGEGAFEHVASVPAFDCDGVHVKLAAGSWAGHHNSAQFYSPLMAAELTLQAGRPSRLPLQVEWEHALITLDHDVEVNGTTLQVGQMAYLPPGCDALQLMAPSGALTFLIGGLPFAEKVLLWWNFVGRTPDELREAREQWNAGDARFGHVVGFDGPRLTAPAWVAPKG